MDDTFTATANQVGLAAQKPKRELTEEQKDALRARLAVARAKRSELARAGKLKPRAPKPKVRTFDTPTPIPHTFTIWSDDEWRAAPLTQSLQRLTDLTADRERGAVIVQQKQNDLHLGNVYHCLVCKKLVPDGRWIWKNDRRDPLTQMWTSDVLCSQICHERFSNNAKFYTDRAKGVS